MPTNRKRPSASAHKAKPRSQQGSSAARQPKDKDAEELAKYFAEDEARCGFDFTTWLRVSRSGKLPQGCTPAQKLAALKAHAHLHGIKPIEDPDTMAAGFWPAAESVDDFVAAIRTLRRQGQ